MKSLAPISLETIGVTMRFGSFTALDDVSVKVEAGTFHALLGENGAGKSTLVKCMMGFNKPETGQLLIDGREQIIADPRQAHALGLGMVYQHFTLAPSLTGAENLLVASQIIPGRINWRQVNESIHAFMSTMPFQVQLNRPVRTLSAGEKQKLEILKQLYLGRRLLILDEPTSVLTPAEADDVLGMIRQMTSAGSLTVLMITHKFREVTAFADTVSILRRGRLAGTAPSRSLSHREMGQMMVGASNDAETPAAVELTPATRTRMLSINGIKAQDKAGLRQISIDSLDVASGEIVGIAGVSGNGQSELLEMLSGQRPLLQGNIEVGGEPFSASREQMISRKIRFLPEEPMSNACAPNMSVIENLSFRRFDRNQDGTLRFWLNRSELREQALQLIRRFQVKTASPDSPIRTLSGGNVQRTVLARELSGEVALLIIANPCFGLDFGAVREIRARIMAARNAGTAILLISEDLDEILELSDRIMVMTEGRITYQTPRADADINAIGQHMAGHQHELAA
ncbi:MAG: ABC transporter ATP-binding protein [Burkholderiaceae bacterium]